jgi:hypothetical protein
MVFTLFIMFLSLPETNDRKIDFDGKIFFPEKNFLSCEHHFSLRSILEKFTIHFF